MIYSYWMESSQPVEIEHRRTNIPIIHILCMQTCDGDICDAFREYFTINYHTVQSRNNQSLLKIRKSKTKSASKSFNFMGVTIYSILPIQVY